MTSTPIKSYTDRLYYADGAVPRYSGCPSARLTSLGGRYNYRFDVHNRLIEADYTPGENASVNEDFSVAYTYNKVGNPTRIERNGLTGYSSTNIELFGLLDNLLFSYDGNKLLRINAEGEGSDFYGRTGYPLSASCLMASYQWHESGLMKQDYSRGINNIEYNRMGLPIDYEFEYCNQTLGYDAAGTLIRKTNTFTNGDYTVQTYAGDRVFSGDSLMYSYFPGGYFDGKGGVFYTHADYQGSITMVTDRLGHIVQHTGYYPYGEPWREPAGQPRLYGGKERERFQGMNDYDFHARRYNSATTLWNAPDPLAYKQSNVSPYNYCFSNPIIYVDPTGQSPISVFAKIVGKAITKKV